MKLRLNLSFDFSDLKDDWFYFINGKYSKMNLDRIYLKGPFRNLLIQYLTKKQKMKLK